MNTKLQAWASERRERLTPLEMAVKVLGARYPVIVAAQIGSDCRDVPAAVAALRQRAPHWFEPASGAAAAADRPVISRDARPYAASLAQR